MDANILNNIEALEVTNDCVSPHICNLTYVIGGLCYAKQVEVNDLRLGEEVIPICDNKCIIAAIVLIVGHEGGDNLVSIAVHYAFRWLA